MMCVRFLTARPSRRNHVAISRVAFTMAACVAITALAGCGRRDLHRVSGVVRFSDGSPLSTGRVVVDYGRDSLSGAWGHVRSDGSFTIGTLSAADGMRAGVVRVAIVNAVKPVFAPDGTAIAAKPLVHPRFADPETSGLSFDVPRQTLWDIIVERP
jgi:hypothetical protein